jgi:hypothetical protein
MYKETNYYNQREMKSKILDLKHVHYGRIPRQEASYRVWCVCVGLLPNTKRKSITEECQVNERRDGISAINLMFCSKGQDDSTTLEINNAQ